MKAWHNDPSIRTRSLNAVVQARREDRLIHFNYYGDSDKGCAIGQIAREFSYEGGNTIASISPIVGLPEWVAHLIESVYEMEQYTKAKDLPERAILAIPVGVELPPEPPKDFRFFYSPISWDATKRQGADNVTTKFESYCARLLPTEELVAA